MWGGAGEENGHAFGSEDPAEVLHLGKDAAWSSLPSLGEFTTGFPVARGLVKFWCRSGSLNADSVAIRGTGSLILDSDVMVVGANGGPGVDPRVLARVTSIPTVRTTGASIGGTAQVAFDGSPNEAWLLAIGESCSPRVVPGVLGALWISDQQLAAVGVFPSSGSASSSLTIANDPGLRGLQLVYQAVATAAGEELRFFNPAMFSVGL